MTKHAKILAQMRSCPTGVRFEALRAVCEAAFGAGRQRSGSHLVFRTPWPGDPRVNIQEGKGGMAKAYQVRQVLKAIAKLEET